MVASSELCEMGRSGHVTASRKFSSFLRRCSRMSRFFRSAAITSRSSVLGARRRAALWGRARREMRDSTLSSKYSALEPWPLVEQWASHSSSSALVTELPPCVSAASEATPGVTQRGGGCDKLPREIDRWSGVRGAASRKDAFHSAGAPSRLPSRERAPQLPGPRPSRETLRERQDVRRRGAEGMVSWAGP